MELIISKSELNRALQVTQNIVEKKTTMPILANVLLSAAEGKFTVAATDLEITAVASASAKVQSTGSTTVSARMFGEIVRELPDGDVHIKLGAGERLEIKSTGSTLRMIGVSAEEVPSLPGVGVEVREKIAARQLLEMINRSLYAVSLDETRFNLNGVCFETVAEGRGKSEKRALRMVATDGHRLAMVTRPVEGLVLDESVIVPRKGLSELRRALDGRDGDIGIAVQDGFLVVETADAKISMRLIDGEFPDYNQVIPKEKGSVAAVGAGGLANALRRVALMVSDKGKCVKLDFADQLLTISSSSPELGEAEEQLEIKYDGPPLTIGFNARYILDIISSFDSIQELHVEVNGKLGPGKFSSPADESYLAILMPMRLSDRE